MMSTRTARWLAWLLLALGLGLTAAGLFFLALSWNVPIPSTDWGFRGFVAIFGVSFSIIGWLIARNRPENPIGWLFLGLAAPSGIQLFAQQYATYALLVSPGYLPAGEFMAWVQAWIWVLGVGVIGTYLFLLFPNGQLKSPRWRPIAWLAPFVMGMGIAAQAFAPGPLNNFSAIENPFGISGFPDLSGPLTPIFFIFMVSLMAASATSLVLRFRESRGDERQQLKWFAYAAILTVFAGFPGILLSAPATASTTIAKISQFLFIAAMAGLPVSIGIAILKYRLYDIDLIINRTLVYGSLTAILAGVYTASIGLFQRLFVAITGEKSDAAIVLTTLVVAAAFTPAKTSLQTIVDKRFKEVSDPTKALRDFGEQVRSGIWVIDVRSLTRRLLDEVATAFTAQSGAVYLDKDMQKEPTHTFGEWHGEAKMRVPLESDGTRYGFLALGVRKSGLDYTPQDRESLQQIASLVSQAIRLAGHNKSDLL
ncbi:MAG: GAF domain-containing protein [Chloroflexi bacterium]|nr:GAF domain-containing protein [Chloroflexota bacterium]